MRGLYVLPLSLLVMPAVACDWVVSKKTDPMNDTVTCMVRSPAAKIAFYKYGTDRPNVTTSSAYREDSLYIRVDENVAVRMGNNARDRQKALDILLPQIEAGKRIRTSFRDYPVSQEGDAEICTLPKLLADCGKP